MECKIENEKATIELNATEIEGVLKDLYDLFRWEHDPKEYPHLANLETSLFDEDHKKYL